MMSHELAAQVAAATGVDPDDFHDRVDEEAAALVEALRSGEFDNPQANVGFEYEFYGVAADDDTAGSDAPDVPLVRVPRRLLELIGFEPELGLHNAEMNTNPQPLSGYGLTAQEAEIQARLSAALEKTRLEGLRLVSDAMWTVPPRGELAREYLTGSVEVDGIRLAANMSKAVRYHAMANAEFEPAMRFEAPHVSLSANTVMPESLITSIQPHYQVPNAADLPAYYRYALRFAGPLLALGVNSPFFPPDLYDDGVTGEAVLADGRHEHRIGVFEDTLNPPDGPPKVAFPPDVSSLEEAVDHIAEDRCIVPAWIDERGRFDDDYRHFTHKHGSYWRWVRPVFEGATRSAAHARIEFRPLPAQPTVRDSVAFLAVLAGLLEECFAIDHPVRELEWEAARANLYRAADDGLGATIEWITADGERTTDIDAVYDDLFETARRGLARRGFDAGGAERYLGPLGARVSHRLTPAAWKRERVRDRLDAGDDLEAAIGEMQRRYVARQAETLIEGTFADWL
ncbi:MAG: hypothetical protein U5J98_06625 [Halobacteriales archaeon]|nr:hypothetical protein [Halobacteriales archaeon]